MKVKRTTVVIAGLCVLVLALIITVVVLLNKGNSDPSLDTQSVSQTNVEELGRGDDFSESTATDDNSSLEDWIKVSCPLCNGGRELEVCPVCKGEGKISDPVYSSSCIVCYAFNKGYLKCPLCDNKFIIKMKNYEKYPSVPTPDELARQVKELGHEPFVNYRCTYCDGGEKLEKCPTCNGSGKENYFSGGFMYSSSCPDCTNGYVRCSHCSYGVVDNENFSVEKAEWKLKLENLLNGVVDKTISEAEKELDSAMAKAESEAFNRIYNDSQDAYNSGSSVGSSSSGGSGYSKSCSHCHGTGTCSRCGGDGYMKNSYLGGEQRCSTCGGSGRCPFC